ncbi:hypothetical protein OC861_005291 [Tilletia horrida]|nr:hypothetical protein OC861_005291 [Tilletia horrida]
MVAYTSASTGKLPLLDLTTATIWGPISHVEDPSPRLTLGKLADIIAQARQGPGLRSFRFEEFSIVPEWSYSAAQKLWEQVGHHAPSLRYLGLRLERMDFPVEVVPETAFAYLEEFSLSFVDADVVLPLVEPFLDGAKRLRSLVIHSTYPEETLSLQQTFPRLRNIRLNGFKCDTDEVKSFATRHPHVVSLSPIDLLPSETTTAPAPPSTTTLSGVLPESGAD